MNSTGRSKRLPGAVALLALILVGIAALLVAGAGPAYSAGLLSLGAAFQALRYGVIVAIGAGALGLIALAVAVWRRDLRPALIGGLAVVSTLALMIIPLLQWQQAQAVPPIHDITTDTDDPPAFEALVAAREKAPNAVAYPGEDTARQQRNAYPDIGPLEVKAPLSVVLKAAEAEVRDFGWELVAVADDSIEATATTTWFGFKDDVVIRLREEGDSVRVDMRSASRVGRSDVGANAARIRAYLDALEQRLNANGKPA
jgi:uncharacterized protein (DUF1499 family)